MQNTHLLNLDEPTGNEFILGSADMVDISSLIDKSEDKKTIYHYNQNEYADKYGYCLCTIYNVFTNISIIIGRFLTEEEKIEMIEERIKIRFNRNTGGYQTDATDIGRKWLQKNFPDKKFNSFMFNNFGEVRRKLFTKQYPIMATYRGNAAFNEDARDGHLDKLSYGEPTYGHAITNKYHGKAPAFTVIDNYNNDYEIKSPDDYYTLIHNGIYGGQSWIFLADDQLTKQGLVRLKLMKLKITNGERPEDKLTRDELAIMIKRINPNASMFWNEMEGPRPVTRSEFQNMIEKGLGKKFAIQIYTKTTKDKTILRGEAWILIASIINV